MDAFVWALAGFVFIHVGVSATGARSRIIAHIGEAPYRIVFSLLSIGLLIWMIYGFGEVRGDPFNPLNELLWMPPPWLRWPAYVLVFTGFVLAASSFTTRNPTMAGMEGALSRENVARGILRITRHPFLWGVVFWAAGHALVNGERFAPMLFGALGMMALFGARSIDRKGRARDPEGWAGFEAVTSNLPFGAIAQGRNHLALGELWLGLAAGTAAFVLVGLFHRQLFGASAF